MNDIVTADETAAHGDLKKKIFRQARGVPPLARSLALAGVIPFAAGVVLIWVGGISGLTGSFASLALKSYSALILSFLGGVHWGLSLADPIPGSSNRGLVVSVVPALVGWGAMLIDPKPAYMLLAIAFAVQGAFDITIAMTGHAPRWYARLRLELTGLVCVLLLLAWWVAPTPV